MDVIVVGAGPAGMMAAISAAENGNNVTLIEQNEKLGKKLFLTGKGRCNITNACPVEELFDNIVTNPKFLYSAFYGFDNNATVEFFNSSGLATKVERGERVFPKSDHSSDVIRVLKNRLESSGVNILLNTRALSINTEKTEGGTDKISSVIIKRNNRESVIYADRLILATGGRSYPATGSDGSMLDVLASNGISVNKCEPSLVPLICEDNDVKAMQGLSLKNVSLIVYAGNREKYKGFGEMLFTHFGISGPLVLSASARLREDDYKKGVKAFIDLKPALSHDELDSRILRDFEENKNKNFENSLGKLLPSKIISAVIKKTGIDPIKKVNSITKQERENLCNTLKNFEIGISKSRGFSEAVITRGGVDIRDINPSTMECKKMKGLFFAGEMIDVDALTGGFNLQIAWSTGHLAGICCKEGPA